MEYQKYLDLNNSDMFNKTVVVPMFGFLFEWTDHLAIKLSIYLSGLLGVLSLELFSTPMLWWKGLTYLVILDWLSGLIVSAKNGEFSIELIPRKIYKVSGYVIACASVAIPANAMPEIAPLYYFQYGAYLGFFVLEIYSIFRHWRLWAFFVAFFRIMYSGKTPEEKSMSFMDLVEYEHEKSFKRDLKNGNDGEQIKA